MNPKVVIINDTRSLSGKNSHAGCEMVMKVLLGLCRMYKLDVIKTIPVSHDPFKPEYKPFLQNADLVIVNGEGTIHHNRPQAFKLLSIGRRYPSVLINAVIQGMDREVLQENLPKFLSISVRESMSLGEILPHCPTTQVHLIPDLVFAGMEEIKKFPPHPVHSMIGITDSVNNRQGGFLITVGLTAYLNQLRAWPGLTIGRFHGICFASIIGIPFNAYPSNTHKNEGILRDMGIPELYYDSVNEAINHVPEKMNPSVVQYVQKAPKLIQDYFETIVKIAQTNAGNSTIDIRLK